MKIGDAHLTYCTNIHPAESWAEVRANLDSHVIAVKTRVCPDQPFGVGGVKRNIRRGKPFPQGPLRCIDGGFVALALQRFVQAEHGQTVALRKLYAALRVEGAHTVA